MDYLEGLREGGTVDSQGEFTVDAGRAWDKLARYQVDDPVLPLLHVIRAAVGAGATRVDFIQNWSELRCHWETDIPWPLPDDLERSLFSAIRHPRYQQVQVYSEDWCYTLRTDGSHSRTPASGSPSATCVTFKLSGLFIRLRFRPSARLAQACHLCQVQVFFNNWLLNHEFDHFTHPYTHWRRHSSTRPIPGVRLPDSSGTAQATELACDAVVGIWEGPSEAIFVVRGIPAATTWLPSLPKTRIIVAAPELQLDLSGLQIIEDDNFRSLTRALEGWLCDLCMEAPLSLQQAYTAIVKMPNRAQAVELARQYLPEVPRASRLQYLQASLLACAAAGDLASYTEALDAHTDLHLARQDVAELSGFEPWRSERVSRLPSSLTLAWNLLGLGRQDLATIHAERLVRKLGAHGTDAGDVLRDSLKSLPVSEETVLLACCAGTSETWRELLAASDSLALPLRVRALTYAVRYFRNSGEPLEAFPVPQAQGHEMLRREQFLASDAEAPRPDEPELQAWLHLRQGHPEKALALLRESREFPPDNPKGEPP